MKRKSTANPDNHVWRDVRRAGVPLVCYETSDPAHTIKTLTKVMNGKAEETPIAQWCCIRGLIGINDAGVKFCTGISASLDNTGNLVACLDLLQRTTQEAKARDKFNRAVIYCHNAHRFIESESVVQAVWNLRDPFEAIGATLVLLATIGKVPLELRNDIVTLTDPLPTPAEICKLARSIADDAKKGGCNVDPAAIEADEAIADTLTGASGFGVRQTFSMSLRREGVDMENLWERKRKLVEQTPGLQMWRSKEGFEQLGGLARIKSDLTALLTSGNTPVRAIGFLDEIEKMLAGAGGDTSGTSQDQLGVILREMQDNDIPGIILAGPPGTGKSAIAKGAGAVAQAPVLAFDFGACKGSLVGESEGKIRAMMQVFNAVSQGKGLFIATCNQMTALPPELRRRFKLGTYYVDLPSTDEQKAIWPVWLNRFELDAKQPLPNAEGWTGAEIAACCEVAHRTGRTLIEAAQNIVPVAKSGASQIHALRTMANGIFLSANKPGVYEYVTKNTAAEQPTGRRMEY